MVRQEVLEELGRSGAGDERVDGRGLLEALRRVRGPVLVVLEDLHSADADSLRLLARLSARLAGLRVLVVATLREHELQSRPGAAEAVASMSSDTRHLVVPPLTANGVAELAAALLGRPPAEPVLRDVIVRSDGNAFFVRELVEAARGHKVPAGVTASVRRRLAGLSGDLVALLEVCACAGREVDPVVLAALGGRPVADTLDLLGPAVAAGVLEDRGSGRLRFRHALVAESLLAGLLPARRSRHHLALARAASATHAVRAVTVAHHLVQAGALAEAAEVTTWSALAAAQAEVAGAPLEAARHLRLAVDHTDDGLQRARLLERLGHCLFSAGAHLGEAVRAFEEALTGYEAAGEWRRCGVVHSRLGSHLSRYRRTSDFDRAARHFERAGTLLVAPVDRAHVLVGTSTLALLRGRPREALTDSQEAPRIAEQAGRPALAATGRLMTGASLLALGRLREGFAALDASFSTGLVVRPTVDVQTAWHGIVTGVALDDPALARSYASRAERALEGADLPGQAQIVSDLLAPAHAIAGDVEAARSGLAPVDLLGFEVQREGWSRRTPASGTRWCRPWSGCSSGTPRPARGSGWPGCAGCSGGSSASVASTAGPGRTWSADWQSAPVTAGCSTPCGWGSSWSWWRWPAASRRRRPGCCGPAGPGPPTRTCATSTAARPPAAAWLSGWTWPTPRCAGRASPRWSPRPTGGGCPSSRWTPSRGGRRPSRAAPRAAARAGAAARRAGGPGYGVGGPAPPTRRRRGRDPPAVALRGSQLGARDR